MHQPAARVPIEAVDDGSPEEASTALVPLFEGAPGFLARLVRARPFGTWERLYERARAIAHDMPEDEQIELANAHPRLGAPPATVSRASFREQGYEAGRPDDAQADPVRARLRELNDAYEARFGFRYCVFVAGRPVASLIPLLEAALALDPATDRATELHRALDAVVDIARARHEAGVGAEPTP